MAKDSLETEWLRRWWCKKYNLPRTDPRYGEYTEEELLLEYFEDIWEKDPGRARQMLGTYEGDIVLETGDAEVDEVERRLAAGEDPETVLDGWGDGLGTNEEPATPVDDEAEFDDDYSDETKDPGLSW